MAQHAPSTNRVRYAIDDHRSDTFLSQVVQSGTAISKTRIEALTSPMACTIMLGRSWVRLGRPGNYIAHLLSTVTGAWQAIRPALREQAAAPCCEGCRRGQGGASDMHDRLSGPSVGESVDRPVVIPNQAGAKSTLGLQLRHNK